MLADVDTPANLSDLVIGLVGPVGADLPWVAEKLADTFRRFGYVVHEIGVSGLIDKVPIASPPPARDGSFYDEYVDRRMTAGNEVCRFWGGDDALAKLAIGEIHRIRVDAYGFDPSVDLPPPGSGPLPKLLFILRSLKRDKEVDLVRQVYGNQFLLIGCHAPRPMRIRLLASEIAKSRTLAALDEARPAAEGLAVRDEHEDEAHGQNVRKAFPLSDYFISLAEKSVAAGEVERFADLVMGRPFLTPTMVEMGMFYARSAAVRSSDLSRQVGAAIISDEGALLAVGCNEVPRAGGGAYWAGDANDARDFAIGEDSNQVQRDAAIKEVYRRLQDGGWLKDGYADRFGDFGKLLDDTRVDGLTEFGRPVHAEMSAILDAARRGVSSQNSSLFTTTFPCHNCAKHIVGAGIAAVVFIEPYPKSLAEQLHNDSIEVDPDGREDVARVTFKPFEGVSPSMYVPLFRAQGKRKNEAGKPQRFDERSARPKLKEGVSAALVWAQESTVASECVRRLAPDSADASVPQNARSVEGAPAPSP